MAIGLPSSISEISRNRRCDKSAVTTAVEVKVKAGKKKKKKQKAKSVRVVAFDAADLNGGKWERFVDRKRSPGVACHVLDRASLESTRGKLLRRSSRAGRCSYSWQHRNSNHLAAESGAIWLHLYITVPVPVLPAVLALPFRPAAGIGGSARVNSCFHRPRRPRLSFRPPPRPSVA